MISTRGGGDTQPTVVVDPRYLVEGADAEDEIRLGELVRILVEQRWVMLAVFAACLAAGLAFLWLVTPRYQADAYLLPPLLQEVTLRDQRGVALAGLALGEFEIEDYSTTEVYDEFLKNLKSRALRREFFERHGLYEHFAAAAGAQRPERNKVFEEAFNANLRVSLPRKTDDQRFVSISLDMTDPVLAAELLNRFLQEVNDYTLASLYEPFRLRLSTRLLALEDEIARRRDTYQLALGDQIRRFREAVKVAESLGLAEGALPLSRQPVPAGIAVNTADLPLYMRGSNALKAEVEALEERRGEDAFVPGLRELQDQLGYLKSITMDMASLRAARVDQAAVVPEERRFPKTLLTLALAAVLGGMLALIAAFGRHGWRRLREDQGL